LLLPALGGGGVGLLVPIGNAATLKVVWSEFDLNLVPRKDADVVHAHLARDMGEDFVAIIEFDSKHGVWEGLDNRALHNDRIFLLFRQLSDSLSYRMKYTLRGARCLDTGVLLWRFVGTHNAMAYEPTVEPTADP
jgi:hypothetical protein